MVIRLIRDKIKLSKVKRVSKVSRVSKLSKVNNNKSVGEFSSSFSSKEHGKIAVFDGVCSTQIPCAAQFSQKEKEAQPPAKENSTKEEEKYENCAARPKKGGQSLKSKKSKAVITPRDMEIMREINRHGFMGAEEISRAFKIVIQTAYLRLLKMTETGLLKHERILSSYPGVYWLTFTGKSACKSELSTISAPSVGTFEHEMKLLRLNLDLKERYGEKLIAWNTARELRAQKFSLGEDTASGFKAMKSHTPDALLIMDAGGKTTAKIALELELSSKSIPRLKGIIEGYAAALRKVQINRVAYYCGSEAIKNRVISCVRSPDVANLFQVTVLQEKQ